MLHDEGQHWMYHHAHLGPAGPAKMVEEEQEVDTDT
jgi:hypothetical protein